MGIRPFAEQLLQGAEQALSLNDLKANEKVKIKFYINYKGNLVHLLFF